MYRQSGKITAALFTAGLLCLVATILYSTSSFGPGITPDSITYLSTGAHIAENFSFTRFDGEPLQNWAPLYPLLLSVPYLLHVNAAWFALGLNILALAGAILICYLTLRKTGALAQSAILLTCISFSFYKLGITIYSETVFIFFQSAYWYFLIRYFIRNDQSALYKAAFFISLMCLQRYAGFMMLAVSMIFLSIGRYEPKKWIRLLYFFLIALLPSLPWLIRNYMQSGNITGAHLAADKLNPLHLLPNLGQALRIGLHHPELIMIGLAIGVLWFFMMWYYGKLSPNSGYTRTMFALWLYCSAYFVLLLTQNGLHLFELPRYISVLYLPLIIYFVIWFEGWLKATERELWVVSILFYFVALGQLGVITLHIIETRPMGVGGFSIDWWNYPEMNNFLNHELPAGKLMSNYPDFIWYKTGREVKFSPYAGEDPGAFKARIGDREYFLWIQHPMRGTCIYPHELVKTIHLEQVKNDEIIQLYRIVR